MLLLILTVNSRCGAKSTSDFIFLHVLLSVHCRSLTSVMASTTARHYVLIFVVACLTIAAIAQDTDIYGNPVSSDQGTTGEAVLLRPIFTVTNSPYVFGVCCI